MSLNWETGLHHDGTADPTVVHCLRGILRFEEALEYAKSMPPHWWPGGFPRAMAAAVITGSDLPADHPGVFPWLTGLGYTEGIPVDAVGAIRCLKRLSLWGMEIEAAAIRAQHAEAKAKWDRLETKRDRARARTWTLLNKARNVELAAEELQGAI